MAFFRSGGQGATGNVATSDVLAGKTFSNENDIDLVGTMPNRGAVAQSLNTSTTSYTIPQGYHNGSGAVSISTQEKTVTPSTSAQNVTPDSGRVLSKVTVNAISTQTKTVTAGTAAASVAPDSGKYLSRVTYNPTPTQEKTATPTTRSATAATVTPDSGKHLSKVTVNTNSVPNSNSATYTYPANSTGGTTDLGEANTYRYVNAANVYNKGKADSDLTSGAYYTNSAQGTIAKNTNYTISGSGVSLFVADNINPTQIVLSDSSGLRHYAMCSIIGFTSKKMEGRRVLRSGDTWDPNTTTANCSGYKVFLIGGAGLGDQNNIGSFQVKFL